MYTSRPVPASNSVVVDSNMVGLVDEQAGGFVGYLEYEKGVEIARRLNFIQGDDDDDHDAKRWHVMDLSQDNEKDFLNSAMSGDLVEIIAPMNQHIGYVLNSQADYAVRAALNAGMLPSPKVDTGEAAS